MLLVITGQLVIYQHQKRITGNKKQQRDETLAKKY